MNEGKKISLITYLSKIIFSELNFGFSCFKG